MEPNHQPSLSTPTAAAAAASLNLPLVYRFCPTDKELILEYLHKKLLNEELPPNRFVDVELYEHTPEQLSASYAMVGENEWYFFTSKERNYLKTNTPNRAVGSGDSGSTNGYWKEIGVDKIIRDRSTTIGIKKILMFYEGEPPNGRKTRWMMDEYRVDDVPKSITAGVNYPDMRFDAWVLCKIYRNRTKL
ncbi:unnamed protein product [Cuscuta epithymum]|uniref:NAC domain-containing protein n=1 Tax=Cuscuta epithymum TaxID=186058 RepID=A0AAV0DSW7_9ASTE|nr:unnamed protein product [Cuscuta epithymum]